MDEVLPKKSSLEQTKLPEQRASLYVLDGQPLFFQQDGSHPPPPLPHLRLVHRFPDAFPTVRIDRGAIRFVLSGATLMAPGLTSKGGRLPMPRPVKETGKGAEKKQRVQKDDEDDDDDDDDDDDEDDEDEDEGEGEENGGDGEDGEGGDAQGEGPREGPDEDGHWSRELEKGEPVVVMAEGKEEACAVGILAMGTREIKDKGKGPVIEEAHYLGDGLWRLNTD